MHPIQPDIPIQAQGEISRSGHKHLPPNPAAFTALRVIGRSQKTIYNKAAKQEVRHHAMGKSNKRENWNYNTHDDDYKLSSGDKAFRDELHNLWEDERWARKPRLLYKGEKFEGAGWLA